MGTGEFAAELLGEEEGNDEEQGDCFLLICSRMKGSAMVPIGRGILAGVDNSHCAAERERILIEQA